MSETTELADRLKDARERAGLTIAQVAKHLGAMWHTVKRYESGENKPSAERLVQLAELYGTTAARLMGAGVLGEATMVAEGTVTYARSAPATVEQAIADLGDQISEETAEAARETSWQGGAPSYHTALGYLRDLEAQAEGRSQERPKIEPPKRRQGRVKLDPKRGKKG